jgi:hypothetical protein
VAAKETKRFLLGPEEGAYLPTLRITHKVTAESFGGAFTSIEASVPPGDMIPHIPTPARTSAPSCWRAS